MTFDIRDLSEADFPEAIRLLCEGFPQRDAAYWRTGLERLSGREPFPDTVRIGHALYDGGQMRGVVLAIPSIHEGRTGAQTFVNISSWYVHSSHRGPPAKALYGHASSRCENVVYTNLSAAAHTLKTITAIGFREWSAGQLLCIGTQSGEGRTRIVAAKHARSAGLPDSICRTLVEHEKFGCISFYVESPAKLSPFIFLRRRVKLLPCAQLIYCESIGDLVSNGRAICAALAMRGLPAMIVDTSGAVSGLRGKYFPGRASKYLKGPTPALAIDHTYSEMIYLGF